MNAILSKHFILVLVRSTILRILSGRHLTKPDNAVQVLGRSAFHDTRLNFERSYLDTDWGMRTVAFAGYGCPLQVRTNQLAWRSHVMQVMRVISWLSLLTRIYLMYRPTFRCLAWCKNCKKNTPPEGMSFLSYLELIWNGECTKSLMAREGGFRSVWKSYTVIEGKYVAWQVNDYEIVCSTYFWRSWSTSMFARSVGETFLKIVPEILLVIFSVQFTVGKYHNYWSWHFSSSEKFT